MTDRDANGRFIQGHAKTGGRAPREREQRYKEIMLTTVSFVDWQKIVTKARDQALKGDAVARKFLADYLVGPPVQRNEHTGADGGPIVIEDDKYDRTISTLANAIRKEFPDQDMGKESPVVSTK